MRIAHAITRLIIGGAQENTLLTCDDLRRQYGEEVLLVTGPGLGPEGSLEAEARQREIPMVVLPQLRREIHPWRDLTSYLAIRRTLADFQPDVVHTHSGKAGLFARHAAHDLGVPAIVHTVHGAPFHPYQNPASRGFFLRCERFAAARCHAIVSVADAMTDQLVAADVAPREKFTTIYSGMEVEPLLAAESLRATARTRLGYTDDDIVVGKIARLFHLKGHVALIEAVRRLAPQHPRLRVLLVGDGILEPQLRRQIETNGMENIFQFVGLVPPTRIPELIAAMDVVVHTSLREGLARVLPQALISGRPVVSYDVDGAREVVVTGETGILVPPCDIDGLTHAIGALASDPELRQRLGQEGCQRFTDQFRHETMTAELHALYERLLAQTQSQARVASGY